MECLFLTESKAAWRLIGREHCYAIYNLPGASLVRYAPKKVPLPAQKPQNMVLVEFDYVLVEEQGYWRNKGYVHGVQCNAITQCAELTFKYPGNHRQLISEATNIMEGVPKMTEDEFHQLSVIFDITKLPNYVQKEMLDLIKGNPDAFSQSGESTFRMFASKCEYAARHSYHANLNLATFFYLHDDAIYEGVKHPKPEFLQTSLFAA